MIEQQSSRIQSLYYNIFVMDKFHLTNNMHRAARYEITRETNAYSVFFTVNSAGLPCWFAANNVMTLPIEKVDRTLKLFQNDEIIRPMAICPSHSTKPTFIGEMSCENTLDALGNRPDEAVSGFATFF